MKNFSVAYAMARRAKGMKSVGPVEPLDPEEDMIQAIIKRRKKEEPEVIEPMDDLDLEPLEEQPAVTGDRKARIAKILGR